MSRLALALRCVERGLFEQLMDQGLIDFYVSMVYFLRKSHEAGSSPLALSH